MFIRPSSFEVLEERLRGRGTEREEDVRRRLERARTEVDGVVEGGLYDTIWRGRLGSWRSGCLEASGVVSRDGMCWICCRSGHWNWCLLALETLIAEIVVPLSYHGNAVFLARR